MTLDELTRQVDLLREALRKAQSGDQSREERLLLAFRRIGVLDTRMAWRFSFAGSFLPEVAKGAANAESLPLRFRQLMEVADSCAGWPPRPEPRLLGRPPKKGP